MRSTEATSSHLETHEGIAAVGVAESVAGIVVEVETGVGSGVDADFEPRIGASMTDCLGSPRGRTEPPAHVEGQLGEVARLDDAFAAPASAAREEIVPPHPAVLRQQGGDLLVRSPGGHGPEDGPHEQRPAEQKGASSVEATARSAGKSHAESLEHGCVLGSDAPGDGVDERR